MTKEWGSVLAFLAALILGGCASDDSKMEESKTAKCGDKTVTQSGTVDGSGDSVGWIAGVDWGSGTLTLNDGTKHTFHYRGVKGLETGIAHANFTGEVYNLENIEDFIGVYYGAGKSFNLVVGSGEFVVNNSKCVVIKGKSKSEGVQLSAPGPGGIHVQFGS